MAFTSTRNDQEVSNTVGTKKITTGTYSNTAGNTGGNIDTGLEVCEHIHLQAVDSVLTTSVPTANETFPVDGSAVTVVTGENDSGTWMAYGF